MAKKYPEIIRGDTLPVGPHTVKIGGAPIPGGIAGWIVFVTLKADLADTDEAAMFTFSHVIPAGAMADASQFYCEVPQSRTANAVPTTGAQIEAGQFPWLDVQLVNPRTPPDEPYVRTARKQVIVLADPTRRVSPP